MILIGGLLSVVLVVLSVIMMVGVLPVNPITIGGMFLLMIIAHSSVIYRKVLP